MNLWKKTWYCRNRFRLWLLPLLLLSGCACQSVKENAAWGVAMGVAWGPAVGVVDFLLNESGHPAIGDCRK